MLRSPWTLRIAILGFIGIPLFFILTYTNLAQNAIAGVDTAVKPATRVLFSLGARLKTATITPFQTFELREEVLDLHAQVRKLTQENARLLELREENLKLRQELAFFESERYPLVVARVVGRIRENNTDFFILNHARNADIEVGVPVLSDGILIGKVIKVRGATSIAVPIVAAKLKTAATFAGIEKTGGIVEGELNVTPVLRLIPKDIAVHTDMPVITSGLEPRIPRGLLIGTVEYIKSDPQELFQVAYLKAPMRFEDVSIVSIVIAAAVTDTSK